MAEGSSFWNKVLRVFGFIFFSMVSTLGSFLLIIFMFGLGITMLTKESRLAKADGMERPRYEYIYGEEHSRNLLLSIPVQGIILGSRRTEDESPFSMMDLGLTYGYEIKKQLEKAASNPDIKGVLLEINTPGGTIFGSQAIFDGVKNYREKSGKPVFTYIQGMSASGGVWSMVGSDVIYADYGSIVGSIGILGPMLMYYNNPTAIDNGFFPGGVVTNGGIESTVITAGRGKDLGNPFRKPSEEEVLNLRQAVEGEYENFVRHVAVNRKIEPEFIKTQLGAMIFDNKKAEEYKLIDGTRSRDDSIMELAVKAGIDKSFKLVRDRESSSPLEQLLGISGLSSSASAFNNQHILAAARDARCSIARQMTLAYYGSLAELCAAH